ncbi:MAG: hypothetical protein QM796_08925 [Chthoniobacteraceae bacterium]
MMSDRGFEKFTEGAFYSPDENVLVTDLFPKNVRTDEAGFVHAIDPVIQRVEPDFAEFLRENPHLIHQV